MSVAGRNNKAFLIYSEFGPNSSIPREIRLSTEFPGVERCLIIKCLDKFGTVKDLIWKYAEEGAERKYTNDELRNLFLSAFLWMNKDALTRAIFLTNYYA